MHQARAASFSHAASREYLCQYCLDGILFSAIAPGYSYNLNIILLQHNRHIHCISIYTPRLFSLPWNIWGLELKQSSASAVEVSGSLLLPQPISLSHLRSFCLFAWVVMTPLNSLVAQSFPGSSAELSKTMLSLPRCLPAPCYPWGKLQGSAGYHRGMEPDSQEEALACSQKTE